MKIMRKLFLSALSIAVLSFGVPHNAQAAYPERPINIIIPFGPGGAVDIAARILAEHFQVKHGVTLNIICKGGGAGVPAMLDVAKARPDGYTFGFPSLATFAASPQIKKTGYDLNSFRAVAQVTNMWLSLAVSADSDIKTFQDLLDHAKAEPGKYNFSTHGALSTQRLYMGSIMKHYPDIDVPHIAYTSGHDVSTALLGKHIISAFGVTTNHKPYVESGDFRVIGISSPERLPDFPDVPTFVEIMGNDKSFTFPSSHGLLAPKRTPDAAVEKMASLLEEALSDPDVIAKFNKAGLSTDYLPPAEFQTVVDDMWKFIGQALTDLNLK